MAITPEKHLQRHKELHRYLDELIADFIGHTGGLPSSCTIMDLMQWSHAQTISPTDTDHDEERKSYLQ
jgi:hypothetical protein